MPPIRVFASVSMMNVPFPVPVEPFGGVSCAPSTSVEKKTVAAGAVVAVASTANTMAALRTRDVPATPPTRRSLPDAEFDIAPPKVDYGQEYYAGRTKGK